MQIIAIGVHKILFSVGDDAVCSTISNGSSRIYPETLLVVWTCMLWHKCYQRTI